MKTLDKTRVTVIAALFCGFAPAALLSQTPAAPAVDTSYMTYDEKAISLPLGVGLRIPRYDRVDGLALPWGPRLTLGKGRLVIDPTVTYRSHLGKFDPYAKGTLGLAPNLGLTIEGGRATFSNDEWIRNTIINSLASIGVGSDARNYFRADRLTAMLDYNVMGTGTTFVPRIGLLQEAAWSTGSAEPHTSAPWSIFERTDALRMRRPNPRIARGHTTSMNVGANYHYDLSQEIVTVDANVEHAFDAPVHASGGRTTGNFTQVTLDGLATFPTFGTQSFAFRGHALITPGKGAPPQRFGYLGGAGTLATVDLLAIGGDRLAYVEGEYSIPLPKPILPFVGTPLVGLRYAAGSAGAGSLPDFIQNIGVSFGVKFIKAEYHVDPNYHKTAYTHPNAFSFGISLSM